MALNVYYIVVLLLSLVTMLCKVWNEEEYKGYTRGKKFILLLREFFYFFLLDWFNIVDYMSCLCTVITLAIFWGFCQSPLSQKYFFQEEPTWVKGKCISNSFKSGDVLWCSDAAVITQFYLARNTFKMFIRICSVNTIFIFLRMLRYLKNFESMRVIFASVARGFEDIAYFVLVMFILLFGYCFIGHIVFGSSAEGFKNLASARRACFEIFLGTFDDVAMAAVSLPVMIIFVFSFWFVFKLLTYNMFLAIVDLHYQAECIDRAERKRLKAELKKNLPKKISLLRRVYGQAKALFSRQNDGENESSALETKGTDAQQPVDPGTPKGGENGEGNGNGETGDVFETAVTQETQPKEMPDQVIQENAEPEPIPEQIMITADKVRDPNWKLLPEDIKEWSLERAGMVYEFLTELVKTRTALTEGKGEKRNEEPEQSALDKVLEEAEEKIMDKRKLWGEEARQEKQNLDTNELTELQKVHQDQESLSWYIMKREAELKKLESAKELKQDRFDKMKRATRSLIDTSDDGGGADRPLAIGNGVPALTNNPLSNNALGNI
jgi:hypothetical protein